VCCCCHTRWTLTSLDYHHYLPIFFDGIRADTKIPTVFLAIKGVERDLLDAGCESRAAAQSVIAEKHSRAALLFQDMGVWGSAVNKSQDCFGIYACVQEKSGNLKYEKIHAGTECLLLANEYVICCLHCTSVGP